MKNSPSPSTTTPRLRSRWHNLAAAALSLSLLASPLPSHAQDEEDDSDIGQQFNKSTQLMEVGKWDDAIKLLDKIIKDWEEEAAELFGPSFGIFYYRKGFAHKMKKEYAPALAAYEVCYSKYANKTETPAEKKNQMWLSSILEMGAVNQEMERYEEAAKRYDEFLSLKPDEEGVEYNKVSLFIQRAICAVKTGDVEKGELIMGQIFGSGAISRTPPEALYKGLISIVEGWVADQATSAATQEKANKFLDEHLHKINITPYDMARYNFNARLLGFARTAVENKMYALAARLYSMIAPTDEVIEDLLARTANYPVPPQRLLDEINTYKATLNAEDSFDIITQINLALLYETVRNYRAAFVLYEFLEHHHNPHKYQPEFLFGATRSAAAVQDFDSATVYGLRFLEKFPTHEYASAVSELLLPNLFFVMRDYDRCLDIAAKIRARFPDPNDPKGDVADFVVGGSHFYQGNFETAQPAIENHLANFPESKWLEHSLYFEGSNLLRLDRPLESGPKLDAFLAKYPSSGYKGYALLDRAECHFKLDELDPTLEKSDRIIAEVPDFPLMDRTRNLRGDVFYSKEPQNLDASAENYEEGKKLAQAAGNDDTAARAMNQLITVYEAQGEKTAHIVALYDEFMEKYSGNVYEAQVVVGAINALSEVGRADEGLAKLKDVIIRVGSGEQEGINLEEAIGSYTQNYLDKGQGPVALEKDLETFAGDKAVNDELNSWIKISLVDLYENEQYEDLITGREAKLKVRYDELREMDPQKLGSYVIVKVARRLRELGLRDTAFEWFDVVINRAADDPNYNVALMGQALLMADSPVPAERARGLPLLDRVIKELMETVPDLAKEAIRAKADVLYANGDFAKAADTYKDLINTHRTGGPEAYYNLGRSYEELGQWDDALAAYVAFFSPPHEAKIEFSADARVRAALIQTEKKGNMQKGYELVKDTVSRMHRRYHTSPDFPEAARSIQKAAALYKEWQVALKITPNAQEEADWGL